jgi:hypothetical protein
MSWDRVEMFNRSRCEGVRIIATTTAQGNTFSYVCPWTASFVFSLQGRSVKRPVFSVYSDQRLTFELRCFVSFFFLECHSGLVIIVKEPIFLG